MKIRYQPIVPFDPEATSRLKDEQHGLHPDDIISETGADSPYLVPRLRSGSGPEYLYQRPQDGRHPYR